MEHIISFIENKESYKLPFGIEITGITFPDPGYRVERIKSKIYCLEYVIAGEGTAAVDRTEFSPAAGDVYILPAGHDHRYASSRTNPWEKIWMNVYGPLCDTLFSVYRLEQVYHVRALNLYPLFSEFVRICEEKDSRQQDILQRCSLLFHEILVKISRHLYEQPHSGNQAVRRVIEYIDRNAQLSLSIETLARIACLSSSQLTRVFSKEMNCTPYEYLLQQKIRLAKQMLQGTGLSVKQVAYEVGFTDEHYFSNVFRKRVGTAPRDFREQSQH